MVDGRDADLYAKGDYAFWSSVFEPASKTLVQAAGVSVGSRVLDVAAGNGNTSLAAAERGAVVTALDVSRAQIEKGRARGRMDGRTITWVEADAHRVPFAHACFDFCLNSFGDVMDVEEMFRVVRGGGVVAIADWTGEGFAGALWQLQSSFEHERHTPGPRLGREDDVRASLAPFTQEMVFHAHSIAARFDSVDWFCSELPRVDTDLDHETLTGLERRRFANELRRLATEWNRSDDGSLLVDLQYLVTVAAKPG